MTIVWAWLTVNGLGLLFAVYDLWDSALDLRLLHTLHIDDARTQIAKANVRSQGVRVVVLLSFIVAGLVAVAGFATGAVRWLLFGSATLISGDAVAARLSRRKVMSNIEGGSKKKKGG